MKCGRYVCKTGTQKCKIYSSTTIAKVLETATKCYDEHMNEIDWDYKIDKQPDRYNVYDFLTKCDIEGHYEIVRNIVILVDHQLIAH